MVVGSPFVYWAQDYSRVTLRIDLKDVRQPFTDITSRSVNFTARGIGAHGENTYSFKLELYDNIDPDRSECRVSDRQVELLMYKTYDSSTEWWPRLTKDSQRLPWLKFDFDKFQISDESDSEVEPYKKDVDDIMEQLCGSKEERLKRRKAIHYRKVYLVLYNLFQFVFFLTISVVLFIRYIKDPVAAPMEAWDHVGTMMKHALWLQLFEVLHPLLGFVPGSALTSLVMMGGRVFILECLILPEPRIHTKPVVFYLFAVYCAIECIRYPYYLLRVCDKSFGFLTYLRYTAWIVLLPLGFLCEGVLMLRCIPYYEETGIYSLQMPNKYNMSFSIPTLLRLYLLAGCFPTLAFLMSHMYAQRKKVLGVKRKHD